MTDRILTVTPQPHPSGATVLTVAGELDHYTAPRLAQAVQEASGGSGADLVLDLAELTYCDSTGMTVLINAYHRTQAAGSRLVLAGLNPDLKRVFAIVGLDQVFTFTPTVEAALESLRS